MTKIVVYIQKSTRILRFMAIGYGAWMGLENNQLGEDVATLKANDGYLDYRLNVVEKRLGSVKNAISLYCGKIVVGMRVGAMTS